uniref:Uncharacterized protein n=1 Tax=Arundo donax TaxID=35708 RepID=A0A0A8ZY00_ARUDO
MKIFFTEHTDYQIAIKLLHHVKSHHHNKTLARLFPLHCVILQVQLPTKSVGAPKLCLNLPRTNKARSQIHTE